MLPMKKYAIGKYVNLIPYIKGTISGEWTMLIKAANKIRNTVPVVVLTHPVEARSRQASTRSSVPNPRMSCQLPKTAEGIPVINMIPRRTIG